MDLLLRQLERRTRQENTLEAWRDYALALNHVVGFQPGLPRLPAKQVVENIRNELIRLTDIFVELAHISVKNSWVPKNSIILVKEEEKELAGILISEHIGDQELYDQARELLYLFVAENYEGVWDPELEICWLDNSGRIVVEFTITLDSGA